MTSDDNRDNGSRGDDECPGQREVSEGLVVEKSHPNAATVAVMAVCQASDSEKSTRLASTAPTIV